MEKDLINLKQTALSDIAAAKDSNKLNEIFLKYFGSSGTFTKLVKQFGKLATTQRPKIGNQANEIKKDLEKAFENQKKKFVDDSLEEWLDVTWPVKSPEVGHLHLVTQAIEEITHIFERIGFTRMRYPEIDWEWYAFESLNMPVESPARDDFETFFIDAPSHPKLGRIVLSPHTSSGQVREMERLHHKPPVRMINIAKCYRPNWDISHVPMFHQFEGLVVDKGINITHLKGTMDYFAKEFFGPKRVTRLRPFHFQFTEPSFEVDINCGICLGTGKVKIESKLDWQPEVRTSGQTVSRYTSGGSQEIPCKLCKAGWLELGGSGMVHPNVLKAGKIDPTKYTGFAFGWGVERTYMMKSGTKLEDIRLLYSNDIRFLEQF